MTDCPAVAAAPDGPAITSLYSADDACLIVDLLGPAAAAAVQHLRVATLLDASNAELKQFGLPAAARGSLRQSGSLPSC